MRGGKSSWIANIIIGKIISNTIVMPHSLLLSCSLALPKAIPFLCSSETGQWPRGDGRGWRPGTQFNPGTDTHIQFHHQQLENLLCHSSRGKSIIKGN